MASRYWVGGTATWDATAGTKWATTSGGAGGAAVPTAADDVFFDVASGTVTVTTSGTTTDVCRSLDCTGFTGTLSHAGGTTVSIGDGTAGQGNTALKLVAGMTYTAGNFTSRFSFVSTSATQQTIDFGGKNHGGYTINGAGSSYVLASASIAISNSTVTLTSGTFDTNGQTCSWQDLSSNNSNARTLTLGSSSVTLSSSVTAINFTTTTNLTFNAGTSTITFSGPSPDLHLGGQTYYTLIATGLGDIDITTSITCQNFTRIGTTQKTDALILSQPLVCNGTFTATGNSASNRIWVRTPSPGTAMTVTAATVSLTNADFMDITAAGAATPFTGTSIGDCLGNTNITFDAPVTQTRSGSGGSWSNLGSWTSRVPLPQDDVIVNAAASGTISGDMPRPGRNIDFTGFAGTFGVSADLRIFGSLTLASGMALSNNNDVNFSGRSSHTFTSAGKILPSKVNLLAPGGSYALQDSMSTTAALVHDYGNFDANGFNVTALNYISTGTSATRSLSMGSGTWSLTSTSAISLWDASGANLTVNAETSEVIFSSAASTTRTFAGAGKTYNNLTYAVANSPGSLTVTGANTFNTITIGPGRLLTMPSSTTNTLSNLVAEGAANGYVYLPGTTSNYISTPDSAPLSITGDIDLRARLSLNDWTISGNNILIGKRTAASTQYSYILYVDLNGKLNLSLSSNGTSATNAVSTVAVPFSDGTVGWVRATWQASDGRVQFFTAADNAAMPSSWTQLGTNLTSAIGSIFNSTAILELGSQFNGSNSPMAGKYYRAQIRNNVLDDGTGIVFDADLAAKPIMANSFTESSSNAATVTINGTMAQAGDGRVSLLSSSGGLAATLSKSSGIISCDYISIKDSAATGGASWYAGANSTNVSNNSGWIFSDVPASGQPSNFLPFFN